jgi:hypothetical protein
MKRAVAILTILTLLACEKAEVKRADAGKMMLKIDGVEHVSNSITALVRPATTSTNPRAAVEASFTSSQRNFEIQLSVSTQDIFKPMDVGEFIVEGEDIPLNYGIIYYSPDGNASDAYISFYVGEPVVGKIIFTQVDTVNKLVSGTFECQTAREDTGEVVVLTEGSFTKIPYTE